MEKGPIITTIVDAKNQKVGVKISNPQDIEREAWREIVETQVLSEESREILFKHYLMNGTYVLSSGSLAKIRTLSNEERERKIESITETIVEAKEVTLKRKPIPLSDVFSKN